MQITAAVINTKGEDFRIEAIDLDAPKTGEVLVRMVASGICHTDMNVKNQTHRVPAPAVLGHEGSGVIEETGPGVTEFEVGDHVVLGFASCGSCRNCFQSRPYACVRHAELNFGGKMEDLTSRLHRKEAALSNFFGQSSFASHSVVNARNAVKVPKDVDIALLGPLGCGLMTGAGTVFNRLQPRPGSTIAVIGAGAVGLSAVMAARIIGCGTIISIDVHQNRLQLAMELGATHTIDASRTPDIVAEIRSLTDGGADFTIEAAGHPSMLRQAVDALAPLGTAIQLGGLPQGTEALIDSNDLRSKSKTIAGLVEGASVPRVLIPQLIDFYKAGKFAFDKLVTYYPFEEINKAGADAHDGKVIKPILRFS
ncbi:MAG: NAD(P)-dependent alcohol dehydrogenase [Acidimicrobiaceae bacterium]|nr:NAD(P)-dependent alcohol dehydrogenase [Acidimicrobiaceae bacterium]